jgi:hypothetical protein
MDFVADGTSAGRWTRHGPPLTATLAECHGKAETVTASFGWRRCTEARRCQGGSTRCA